MKIFNIKTAIRWLIIIVIGVLISGILEGKVNILVAAMRFIGSIAAVYTLFCIFDNRQQKDNHSQLSIEYSMMLLLSGVTFLLASVMESKSLFNYVSVIWIVVIVMAVIKLWKGAS